MIDNCPFRLPAKYIESFENDDGLSFITGFDEKTGNQPTEKKTAQLFSNLSSYRHEIEKGKPKPEYIGRIQIKHDKRFGRYVYFNLNLQHVYNGKCDNAQQFKISQVIHAIELLAKRFQFVPADAILHPFEFGVNIQVPDDPDLFLNNFIMHGFDKLNCQTDTDKTFYDNFRKGKHKRIKLYNKGKQFPGNGNLLRVEIALLKMDTVQKTGIKTLKDLTNPKKLKELSKILTDDFAKLLVYDWTINEKELDSKTRIKLLEGRNYNYWAGIENVNTKSSYKQRYRELLTKTAKRDVLNEYSELLKKQLAGLFDVDNDCMEDDLIIYSPLVCKTNSDENTKNPQAINDSTLQNNELLCIEIERSISVQNVNQPKTTIFLTGKCSTWSIDQLEDFFMSISIPDKPIKLSQCETITNPPLFVEAHLTIRRKKSESPFFNPYLKRLRLFAEIIQNQQPLQ
jgi:hypothetical protein